ncbi:CDP-alcohol phosphatidyltransferase family protein [Terasakiella pusilla]|uniref:CDP-alcohol phosphatidyltransferase family protein n=1 Tax=Terasakiella pusilla TaxID=64973 RepID=UPI00048EA843|nr:CDP-alcohol phosphatidyltransferase family protein [Terasakiella pusilla]
MIDGNFKSSIDKIWNFLAKSLVTTGVSANTVTFCGFLFMVIASALYPFWNNTAGFALVILVIFAFDSLDGAVARMSDSCTSFGGYMDAIVDRYQEIAVYAALAYTHDCWEAAFFVITGSLMVSYTKARTAVERPIENDNWPDLMERLERVLVLCAGLFLSAFITLPESWPFSYMTGLLTLMGALTYFTAFQRFFRAKKILEKKLDD